MSVSEQLRIEQTAFVAAVAGELTDFLTTRQSLMAAISPDIDPIMGSISNLVTGGKRLRALMCYWGWRGAGGEPAAQEIVTAGSALELFQAAALIHDDIIDRSDTRRGGPSVHRRFSQLHHAQGWALDSERFGQAAAILTGDLCLSFSEEAFTDIGAQAAAGSRARLIFNLMRAEVMAGQYLDILEEVAGPVRDRAGAVTRAQSIIRFKSAKYSTEHPLALGGALADAPDELLRGYSAFALPLGEAFQLRDDVLGVFGDPVTTGKPAGDDLREGKRTVLIALALGQASTAESAFIDAKLGSPDLGDADVAEIRRIIEESGALQATEVLINEFGAAAYDALEQLPLEELPKTALRKLAEATVSRAS
ncbi:polyprenyl synthetase family protein [Pseudarthrobacter raffinosi]|uniref:polyprenyl synthetase family protein n=1 Tax=Pseudarthrobacter raffinosi TaxID=2953651 RepID=UPI00208E5A80|nr:MULTISPECIES: polyprenyl synthetase family protein [unclassified Pseudarthrobacter]MCO4238365.1 polyprenyl synthetase family protein [Pseudarthrobacter sp. MDT3-28]MCO4251041.1 polyprenyl synthetase family protein [Pseudarthrobacter sp. MDT3-9]MCO4263008.1 polyprenyl synthetase family protein [Pseudarthrobacter sp. MDT3-26]